MLEKYYAKLKTIALMIAILFNFCSSDGYKVKITNENGIKVVINPDYPKFEIENLKLEEVISIGEKDGDINHTFYRLNDITVDNNGNIYTVDDFDKIIRVFDNAGKFKNTIGRSGQGPGEFSEPARIFIDSKGVFYIHDSGNESRVTRFTHESEYIDDFKIGIGNKLIGIDVENNLYVTDRLSWDMKSGSVERSFGRLDENGNVLNTIATLEGKSGTPYGGGAGSWNTGYEHGAINYAIRQNGDLIVGKSDKYMFSVYDKLGNLKLKFGREYDSIPLTESDKEKLSKDPDRRKLLPSTKPAFKISYYRFLIDDDENFWALTFERENDGITYDIFNKEGIYIKKVFLEVDNRKLKPIIIKNGILYAIHLDEDFINRVKGYKLSY